MRRKRLQDFANVCCQMFLTSMANYDRINLVIFGPGELWIDFVNQRCSHNNLAVSPMNYCVHYRNWLENQCDQYNIDLHALTIAELRASITVETSRRETVPRWLTTSMDIDCSSRIVMDGVEYQGQQSDKQIMGLGQILLDHSY